MARTDEPFGFVSQKSSKSANVLHRDLAQLNGFEAPHFSIALPALGLATHLSVAVAVAQADSPHLADDRLLGEATTHHVPRITCDQAGRADYPHHFGDAFGRVGNEEDYQCHDGCIEPASREGKCHRVAVLELRHAGRGPRTCKRKLPLGRINSLHLRGRASLHQQLREGTVAAAHIDSTPKDGANHSRNVSPSRLLQVPIIGS